LSDVKQTMTLILARKHEFVDILYVENSAVASPGVVGALSDLDGDATPDFAVSAAYDDGGGNARGAVYVLFLHSNGTVKAEQKISDKEGNFLASLVDNDRFGGAVAGLDASMETQCRT
jgi:hypothetical protein